MGFIKVVRTKFNLPNAKFGTPCESVKGMAIMGSIGGKSEVVMEACEAMGHAGIIEEINKESK